MKFHKEGYTSLLVVIVVIILANVAIYYWAPDRAVVIWTGYVVSFLLLLTVLQFFRSPLRNITVDERTILCPADGKVVIIEEAEEPEYFKDRRLQVSIFMSPVNVHVNRNPVSGVVSYFKYHKGKFLVAWHPKSSTHNERTTVVVKTSTGQEVLFRQIAGALARRIVWYIKQGQEVEQGEEFGFIKFGSRVDLFLPLGTQVNVQVGDKVTGGVTVIGSISDYQAQ